MKLRQTWMPNKYGIPACIWCDLPAARCVIEEPCEGRKRWEAPDEDVHQCRSCDQRNDTHKIGCPMHPDYNPDLT